jgi:hypothetical protein
MMLSAQDAKKLRPSLWAGLIVMIGIVLVHIVQLSLNMVLTQDAYHLRELNNERRALNTEVQIIQEQVDSLASPQNLADAANRLGMVANPDSVLLDIERDRVFGKPEPASAAGAAVASANLVANSALGTTSEFTASSIASTGFEVSVETADFSSTEVLLENGRIPASPTR